MPAVQVYVYCNWSALEANEKWSSKKYQQLDHNREWVHRLGMETVIVS